MTRDMAVDHYENFPVASVLLPRRLRSAVAVVYHFARSADDIADEGNLADAAREAGLQGYRDALDVLALAETRGTPVPPHFDTAPSALFSRLGAVVREHRLPLEPFYDLLSAFSQDVRVKRYADFAALRDYTRRSADPVGRIMLHLFEAATPANVEQSDAICTALQLINFWQDVAVDWRKGRIYLPGDALARFEVDEAAIARGIVDARWRGLMREQIDKTRELMLRGAGLPLRLKGRFGFELRLVVQGGLRILEKIEAVDYDVFARRPTLKRGDGPILLARALTMRA